MQIKLSSLRFGVFRREPGKKKEGKKEEEKNQDRWRKNTHKNFYCRVEKICQSNE